MAQLTVVGATGGLGANVVAAALSAGHEVVALVRDAARARLAPGIRGANPGARMQVDARAR